MLKLIAAFLLAAGAAAAQVPTDVARLSVLPGWRQADGTHVAALRIDLAPGWKTYWRAPGEAGIPPRLDLQGSQNVAAARLHWPVPEVFEINGYSSIGYSGSVVLPLSVRPAAPDRDARLGGAVELGVCETVCIPISVGLDAVLPAEGGAADPAIRAALADRPQTLDVHVTCRIDPIADGLRLTAEMPVAPLGPGEVAVIEPADPTIWVSEVLTRRTGGTLSATADLVPPEGAPFALDRSALRLTVLGGGQAIEMIGCSAG